MTTTVTIALYLAFAMWRAYRDRKCEQAHEITNRRLKAMEERLQYFNRHDGL